MVRKHGGEEAAKMFLTDEFLNNEDKFNLMVSPSRHPRSSQGLEALFLYDCLGNDFWPIDRMRPYLQNQPNFLQVIFGAPDPLSLSELVWEPRLKGALLSVAPKLNPLNFLLMDALSVVWCNI